MPPAPAKKRARAEEDPAALAVEAYFRDEPRFVTRHHLDSYNRFVGLRLRQTVQSLNPFAVPAAADAEVYIGGVAGDEITIKPPTATPAQCRRDDQTYACEVTCNITVRFRGSVAPEGKTFGSTRAQAGGATEVRLTDVPLMRLPVMLHSDVCLLKDMPPSELLRSGECAFDQGGYFVVGGLEKVVVAQERGSTNRLFVKPVPRDEAAPSPYSHHGRIRCLAASGAVRSALFPKVLDFYVYAKGHRRQHAVVLSMPGFPRPVPVGLVFRALGVESDRAIVQRCGGEEVPELQELLRHSILDAPGAVRTQAAAQKALAGFLPAGGGAGEAPSADAVKLALAEDVFPTAGASFDIKASFLGDAVRKLLLTAQGVLLPEDRDDMRHKRLDVSGALIANLFRDFYNRYRLNCTSTIEREYNYGPWKNTGDIQDLINPSNRHRVFDAGILTEGFLRAFRGNWQVAKSAVQMETVPGVAQDMSRLSYMSAMSHLRRLNTPLAAVKVVDPHRLHGSQWGYVCPVESPDGGSIGLLKNLAALTYVTSECGEAGVRRMLLDLGVRPLLEAPEQRAGPVASTRVLLNNVWMGTTERPAEVAERARLYRRNGFIHPMVSVRWRWADREIHVGTDAGRYCRPLLIVDEGGAAPRWPAPSGATAPVAWKDIVKGDLRDEGYHKPSPAQATRESLLRNQGCVEFLDPEETDGCMIAMTPADLRGGPSYTHVELHPSAILSFVAQAIPFAQHNQAPRNVLSCAQSKQGIGIYATNFRDRLDKMACVLHHPQRSLVTTRGMRHLRSDVLPYGENVIVAVQTYTGYNIDDAVIVNRTAVQRGLLNVTYYQTVTARESAPEDEATVRFIPGGLPRVGATVRPGDALVRFTRTDAAADGAVEETALRAGDDVHGTVDVVHAYPLAPSGAARAAKIKLRHVRQPELGDKLSSRHGQKGVVGMLLPAEDMPFTAGGLVPDLIITPMGMPSRMTVAHLMETTMGKLCCLLGVEFDATAFEGSRDEFETCCDLLQRLGMQRYGDEVLYDGASGRQIRTDVFVGACYYQRLKHMVADKINYRATGGMMALTHQPLRGRTAGGGLRVGEMEGHSLLGHGAMAFLKESFMERSDGATFGVEEGGRLTSASGRNPQVAVPYSWKLLTQELGALGLDVRLAIGADADADADDDDDAGGSASAGSEEGDDEEGADAPEEESE